MWESYQASLPNIDGSTQVPISAWNIAHRGTGVPPPFQMTYTVLHKSTTQPGKKNQKKLAIDALIKARAGTWVKWKKKSNILQGIQICNGVGVSDHNWLAGKLALTDKTVC
jgi:hypothetical protein